jgi:plastocyanin
MRSARAWAVALIGAVVLGLALPAQASVLVRARCNFFDPARVSVSHGTKVVWRGACGTHTVTAYGGNWSKNVTIHRGETTSRIFRRAGVYRYRCTFHSVLSSGTCTGMCGRVRVT